MENLLDFYQNVQSRINPDIFQIGFFSLRWYSLMYLVGFLVIFLLLMHRIKKDGMVDLEIPNLKSQIPNKSKIQNSYLPADAAKFKIFITDLLICSIIGLLIGARVGYVFFYNFQYYLNNPLEIFLPVQITNYGLSVTGYSGMSYFGGLIGILIAGYIFSKKRKISFIKLADFVVPAIPAGYFFGRIGNFLNGELFGRVTEKPWGMDFGDGLLRHPSQLYEAFFEGLVLFLILWIMRNKTKKNCHPELACPVASSALLFGDSGSKGDSGLLQGIRFRIKSGMTQDGSLLIIYFFFYGFFRFFIEFFREPDQLPLGSFSLASQLPLGSFSLASPQLELIFGWLTLGQLFSLSMTVLAAGGYFWLKKRDKSRI